MMSNVDTRIKDMFDAARLKALGYPNDEVLPKRGGNDTSGGMTDDWKASVDRQLEQLHGDVRSLLYGLVGGFLFLIAGGAAAYAGLAGQIADGRKEISAVQVELVKTNAKLDMLIERGKNSTQ